MNRLFAACLASLALATTSGGCSSDSPNPKKNDAIAVRFVLSTDGSRPRFLDVPFPADVYLAGGAIAEDIPGFSDYVLANGQYISHELAKLDGFSRIAHVFFRVDDLGAPPNDDGTVAAAELDATSLPARETDCTGDASSVFLVDMGATDPAKARVPCRADYHDDRVAASLTRPVLAVGPARGVVLEAGHPYAVVVTARVRAKSGKNVEAPQAFKDATAAAGFWGDAARKATALLGSALGGTSIVAIAPYTTHTRTNEIYALRDTLEAEAVPTLSWDAKAMAPMGTARFAKKPGGVLPNGFTASLDDWLGVVDPKDKLGDGSDDPSNDLPVRAHDKIAAFGTAAFEASYYLQEKPGGYPTLDHATFARGDGGAIVRTRAQRIWVSFAVPDGAMPASGWPTLVVQHGMGNSRAYLLDLMNEVAKAGILAVAVDSLTFGARSSDPAAQMDQHTAFESAPGATYKGPDGLSDAPPTATTDLFGQLQNVGAFRDQLRQASIDTSQLVRVLRSGADLSALATSGTVPRIDPDRVGYLGESLGSFEGEVACAIEPNLRAWFFSVGGGGIILEAAAHGPGLGSLLGVGAGLEWHFLRDRFTESHPLVNLIQTVIEPADAILYAQHLVRAPRPVAGVAARPRNVALLEVLWDELVANESGEALARAIGMGLATPNVGSNAGTIDLADESKNTGRVPLADAKPDGSGAVHDFPFPGVTAAVVQASPAGHGYDIVRKQAKRSYAIPYVHPDAPTPFLSLGDKAFWVRDPNLALTETVRRWFTTAFAGGAPSLFVLAPPARDFDDDGVPDDKDRDPNDPNVK